MGQSASTDPSEESVNMTSIIGIGVGERRLSRRSDLRPAPVQRNASQNIRVLDTATVIMTGKGKKGEGDDLVSTYSIDESATQKDDGTAPLLYPFRFDMTEPGHKKTCCFCCTCSKKNSERVPSFDDTTIILHSVSHPRVIHGNLDGENNFEPLDPTELVRSSSLKAVGRYGKGGKRQRRTRIPNRPDVNLSLWSIVKNAIGKDLTKLPLPVNFNEPLSMLQRLTEDFEYSELINKAANCKESIQQMAYVVAFTVSSYASSALRTGKPFNPLLGETYECDRSEDLGWRCINEQVSHHPPLVAQYCQGRKWECWQQFSMSSKFRGNSIEIVPLGISHLLFNDTGNHYTWRKVPSVVHNIMLGKLWIDQEGEMDVFNHCTGDSCHIKYTATPFFRGDAKRVDGTIYNARREPKVFLTGFWDQKMESQEIVRVNSSGGFSLGPKLLLWTRNMPASDSDRYYNFTVLACQLNEMEDGIAPTDSRRRSDQRLMESGYFDEANIEKLRLEEKQRTARKARQLAQNQISKTTQISVSVKESDIAHVEGEPGYLPAWFELQKDPVTGRMIHMFKGEYWKCKANKDWSRCPDIFNK